MKNLQTVTGLVGSQELGLILPHEHLFTDLRGPAVSGYAQAGWQQVLAVVLPYLEEAHRVGVTALVECSTVGVGRNVAILQHLAEASPVRIIAPTGVYRQAYIPQSLWEISAEALAELWINELTEGIDQTSIKAGFIKLALSDDGPTALEIRNLKAAAQASRATSAVIASHTIGGRLAQTEMDILEAAGLELNRFIWVHASVEPDTHFHLDAARRGAYIEFDTIGAPWQEQESLLSATTALLEAGYTDRLLLSHDAGWYDPSRPNGRPEGGYRGYTALTNDFLPALQARGVSDAVIQQMTHDNPAQAFAIQGL